MTTQEPWIKIDEDSFHRGYRAGLDGYTGPPPKELDGYSFAAGLVEGRAKRLLNIKIESEVKMYESKNVIG